jgi:Ca2+-binding RTX toxin-like protein
MVPDDGTATLAPSRGDGSVTLSWVILPPTPPAPAFTSAAVATFHRGQPGQFTITTSGEPRPILQLKAGSLPAGLLFSDNGDGTATISGTPTGRIGIRWLTMAASSQAGTAEQQLGVSVTVTNGACANLYAGTPGVDTMIGSSAGDRLLGLGGDDHLTGRLARDCVIGGIGNDDVRGGRGADTLQGRADADVLSGGAGRDRIRGGQGDDVIHARDGQIDDIRCGLGQDRVTADPEDQLSGCESKA